MALDFNQPGFRQLNRLLSEIPDLRTSVLGDIGTENRDAYDVALKIFQTFPHPEQYASNQTVEQIRGMLTPLLQKYPEIDANRLVRQVFDRTVQSKIAREQQSSGFLGEVLGDLGRILSGVFTLGLSEIQFNNQRLGQTLRLDPFYSGNISGGNIVTGATSENERQQFEIAFKAGTALASVSALTAGSDYSLSGGLSKLVEVPTGYEHVAIPASAQAASGLAPSKLAQSGFGILGSEIYKTAGNFFGTIGQAVTQILSGDFVGGFSRLIGGGGSTPTPRPPGGSGGGSPQAGFQSASGGGGYGGGGSAYGRTLAEYPAQSTLYGFVALFVLASLALFMALRKE